MSVETMQAFVNKVANTEALHGPAIDAWTRGGLDALLNLGQAQGFEFTAEDVIAVRDTSKLDGSPALSAFGEKLSRAWEAKEGAELTDAQLEMVAGGGTAVGGPTLPPKT